MKNKNDWSKSHNGVMLCSFKKTEELMPEVVPILWELVPKLEYQLDNYLVDVKIHMLMPGQFPCIPNWHFDFLPRNQDGKRDRKVCPTDNDKMYTWISGEPLTIYKDAKGKEYTKPANVWSSFTRKDIHRGDVSKIHSWRCFIRVIPKHFVHKTTINIGQLRQHIQVYLDASKFSW